MNPDTFWKIVGGFKGKGVTYKLANAIKHNTAKENTVFAEAQSRFSEMSKKKGFFEFAAGKDAPVKVAKAKLSQMETVNLIKLLDTLSETNTRGGARIFNVNNFVTRDKKGNITNKISLQDIVGKPLETVDDAKAARDKLYSKLSPIAKEYMSAVEDVFETLKGEVDATYYGINGIRLPAYSKGKYAPVHYVSENGASTRDAAAYDLGILDQSYLHERSRQTGGDVLIEPMSSVVDKYIGSASKYVAWADMADQLRMMEDGGGHFSKSLSSVMDETFGKAFSDYAKNYVNDVGNFGDADTETSNVFLRRMRQHLQTGALMGSISVPIKQISSYWSASSFIDMDLLVAAYRYKFVSDKKTGAAENALYLSRKLGSGGDPTVSEVLTGDSLWNKIKNKSKIAKLASQAIPFMDTNTVGTLYKASAMQVARDNPNLDKNSSEFKRLVEDKFTDVVTQTQPIFTRNARAAYARSKSEALKAITMFRTQQTQNLNRLVTTFGEFMAARGTRQEDEAFRVFRSTFKGQAIAAVSFSILSVAADLAYHNLWKYRDDDDEDKLDPTKILSRLAMNSAETAAGVTLFGSELVKYAIDVATKGKTTEGQYGISLGAIDTAISALKNIQKTVEKPTLNNMRYLAGDLSTLFGIPLNNAYRMVNSMLAWGNSIVRKSGYDVPVWDDILRQADKQLLPENRFYNAYYSGRTDAADRAFDAMVDRYGEDALPKLKSVVIGPGLRSGELSERQAENLLLRYSNLTQEEAVSAVNSYQSDIIRDDFQHHLITEQEAENRLVAALGIKPEEAEKRVDAYKLKMDVEEGTPLYRQITGSFANDYYEFMEPAGISLESWGAYSSAISKIEGDKDEDGNTISGSRDKHLISYISSLALTNEQKAVLFRATTGSESFYNDYADLEDANVSLATWYKTYSDMLYITSDKDENGETVTNSRCIKIIDYLNSNYPDVNQRAQVFSVLLDNDSSYNKKLPVMQANGFSTAQWYKLYTETIGFKSIKDANGKVINAKQDQWIDYLASSAYSDAQRRFIWTEVCGYKESTYPKSLSNVRSNSQSVDRYGRGNIDLYARDTGLYDRDGNLMTVRSISINEDGKEILIPTIVKKNGRWVELTDQEAIDWYHRTGEYLGKFNTVSEANAYAVSLHNQQARLYG